METTDFDVIVVGFGPTGAVLSALLGQQSLRVAVLDKLPDLYPLPRAIGLDHEAMRIIQQLGVADLMQAHLASYRPSEYLGMDGMLIKRLDTLPEPHLLGWEPNYVFDQPAFERVLRRRVRDLPNVTVFLQAEVTDAGELGSGVWAEVRLAGSAGTKRIAAKYLVACDGGGSPIRKRLAIELEDLNFDEPWLVVDAIVSEDKLSSLPQTQVQYCEASRPSTFVVGPGRHRRWEIMLLDGDSLSPEFPEDELWPLLKRWIKPGDAKLWRAAAYRFHGLVARQWRRGRFFLAGDAAHMTPPFMAQGMVAGMRDAHNLAWKLERVLQHKASESLLDSYEVERKPHVTQTVLTAMALGRIICERDPDKAVDRDARLRAAHDGTVRTEYRQNMIPNLTTGLISVGASNAGCLFPQPRISGRDASPRLDDLTGARVRLVTIGPVSEKECLAYAEALQRVDGVHVQVSPASPQAGTVVVDEEHPLIEPWLRSNGCIAAVIRPDHYVFGAAASHSQTCELLKALTRALT